MACYHPSKVEVMRRGSDRTDLVTVPCGKCLGCRADYANDWATRCYHEAQIAPPALFATLTYESVPENGSLCATDFQRFLKRLRKRVSTRFTFYGCGEYGEKKSRPHYHTLFFGIDFLDRELVTYRHDAPVWHSELLSATWKHGFTELTPMNWAAARYVAGYVAKKSPEPGEDNRKFRVDSENGEIIEVESEFARMSRRPAIGRRWISKYWPEVYPNDFVVVNGRESKPPRYYDKWMDQDHRKRYPSCLCDVHRGVMEEVRYQRWKDIEEIGDEKLIMKEKIHRARNRLFQQRNAF